MAIPTRMAAREETVCDTGDDDEDSSSEGVHETFLANITVEDVDVGYVLFPLKKHCEKIRCQTSVLSASQAGCCKRCHNFSPSFVPGY